MLEYVRQKQPKASKNNNMHIPERYNQESTYTDPNEEFRIPSRADDVSQLEAAAKKNFEFPASLTAATLAIAALIGAPAVHTVASGQVGEQFGSLTQTIGTVASAEKTITIEEGGTESNWIQEGEIADEAEPSEEEMSVSEVGEETPAETEKTSNENIPSAAEPENIVTIPLADLEEKADFSNVTAADFQGLSIDEKVELIGKMAREDDKQTGIPASLTAAQAIIESGWMESGLTTNYENYYGIKASSDGYNWPDSTWDGRVADLATGEEYGGVSVEIVAGFRVYDNAWQSMRDHSAYLLNNTRNNGAERRYPGIEKCETAEEAVDIVIEGGYATSSSYKSTIMSTVEKYNLTRFDYTAEDAALEAEATLATRAEKAEQIKKEKTDTANISKGNVNTPDKTEKKTA